MGEGGLKYDRMVERALRGVVREALAEAVARGLPGGHHFYITFRTTYPGVDIDGSLRARYPEELTIVLQHQFWGLEVDERGFKVTLSFNDRRQRLIVPLAAVTAFTDPSVSFGLQFNALSETQAALPGIVKAPKEARAKPAPEAKARAEALPKPKAAPEPEPEPASPTPPEAKIVTLDSFRKK